MFSAAPEAYQIGLVSQVTEDSETLATAIKMAEGLGKITANRARTNQKEVALLAEDVPLNAGLALERKSFQMLFSSEDQKRRHASLY